MSRFGNPYTRSLSDTDGLVGIDFGVYYNWEMGKVKLDASFQGTYYTKYLFEAVPGSGLNSVLGLISRMPDVGRARVPASEAEPSP